MPSSYRTVTLAKSVKGKRTVLRPAVPKHINIGVYSNWISVGEDWYTIDNGGIIHYSDSLYAYECHTTETGAKCAISIGKCYGEREKYRIIIMWDDSMYVYKAN